MSKIKALADLMSFESPLLDSQTTVFSLSLHRAERASDFSGVSFKRALISFLWALPPWPNHIPKAPSSTITFQIRISTHEFGGDHKPSDCSR